MILDTSFLIDLMSQQPEAVKKFWELQEQNENLFIATPAIFELWSGIARSSKPEAEKKKVAQIVESQMILSLEKGSAEEAGKIDGFLCKEGQTIDPEDCMIAGIAKYYDEVVLTRNVKHFNRIKGLKIESY